MIVPNDPNDRADEVPGGGQRRDSDPDDEQLNGDRAGKELADGSSGHLADVTTRATNDDGVDSVSLQTGRHELNPVQSHRGDTRRDESHGTDEDGESDQNPGGDAGRWGGIVAGWLTVGLLILMAATYVLVAALMDASKSNFSQVGDFIVPRLVDVVIFAWAMWVGSSIGSFLNVVAYRLPLGRSVSGRSFCPNCKTQLAARDNVPVLGWIFLGGRCRSCRLPISARYPIVELCVGLSLTLLAMARLYNVPLPHRGNPYFVGRLNINILGDTENWIILIFQVVAVSSSWGMGLIRIDGNKIPTKWSIGSLLILSAAMVAAPFLIVVSWRQLQPTDTYAPDGLYFDALLRVISGLVSAAFFGRALSKTVSPDADLKMRPLGSSTRRLVDTICLLAVPTLVVGWQSALAVLVVASLAAATMPSVFGESSWWRKIPSLADPLSRLAICLPAMLSLHIAIWAPSQNWPLWPSDVAAPAVILVWALAAVMIPVWLRQPRAAAHGDQEREIDDDIAARLTDHQPADRTSDA